MGSYAATIGGTTGEALEDFTGGILEGITLTEKKYSTATGRLELFDMLLLYQSHASLMGASITVQILQMLSNSSFLLDSAVAKYFVFVVLFGGGVQAGAILNY